MSIKQINEGFRSRFENVLRESCSPSAKDELRAALEDAAFNLSSRQILQLKAYEIAFQDAIEKLYPDNMWWEITDCNIYGDLLAYMDIDHTINEIINQLKCNDDTVDEAMMMPAGSDKEAEMAKDSKGNKLIYKNGLGYSVFNSNDVSLGGFDEIKDASGKVDHEAAKKKFMSGNFNESKSINEDRANLKESYGDDFTQCVVDYIYEYYGYYMSSLGADGEVVTFEVSEEVDSEDGLNFDDFRSDLINKFFLYDFDLTFELEDPYTILINVKEIIHDWDHEYYFERFVESAIPYEGRCKYCSIEGSLPDVSITWISQEEMNEYIAEDICERAGKWFTKTVGKDVNIDATMYCRDTPNEKYTASFTVGGEIVITEPVRQPDEDEVAERVRNYLEHQPHSYKNTDPDDAEDVCEELAEYLFGISYEELEASYALYSTIYDYLAELNESLTKARIHTKYGKNSNESKPIKGRPVDATKSRRAAQTRIDKLSKRN